MLEPGQVAELLDLVENKALPVGTKRTWGPDEYQKTRSGWEYIGQAVKGAHRVAKAVAGHAAKVGGQAAAHVQKHGVGSVVKSAAKGLAHMLVHPIKAAWKIATNKESREQFKGYIKKAVKKEAAETKHLVSMLRRAYRKEKMSVQEKADAVHQAADLAKVAFLGIFAGHHAASMGLAKFAAAMASPVDEVAGVLLDKPIRRATERLFGRAHGLLPSAFYAEAVEPDDDELLDKFFDLLFDEISKEDWSDTDEIEKALSKLKATKQASNLGAKLSQAKGR